MRKRILRRPMVKELTGLSNSTIDRKEKAGTFPMRMRLSKNSVGWLENDIDDWIKALERGGTEPPEAANRARRTETVRSTKH